MTLLVEMPDGIVRNVPLRHFEFIDDDGGLE